MAMGCLAAEVVAWFCLEAGSVYEVYVPGLRLRLFMAIGCLAAEVVAWFCLETGSVYEVYFSGVMVGLATWEKPCPGVADMIIAQASML